MSYDFKDVMSEKTDEELIEIITIKRHHYNPKAVETAKKEAEKRNIPKEQIEWFEKIVDPLREMEDFDNFQKRNRTEFQIRLIHFVVDTLLLAVISIFLAELIFKSFMDYQNFEISIGVTFFFLFFVYYIFLETRCRQTLGKFLTKTKVFNEDGTKPSLKKIILRTFIRLTLPFEIIIRLVLHIGFDFSIPLHDRLSSTMVRKLIKPGHPDYQYIIKEKELNGFSTD